MSARRALCTGAIVCALGIAACGREEEHGRPAADEHAPAATAPAISQAVVAAERDHETARQEVEARKQDLAAAQQALEEAQRRADAASQRVTEAQRAAELGSDASLFRSVQSRLLEDETLRSVAISASVREGAVTLSGRVPDAAMRERAVAIARETPGVRAVDDEIEVAD